MKTYKEAWAELARNKLTTSVDHVTNCIIKAVFAKTNAPREQIAAALIRKHFTPTRNEMKLANGWSRYKAVELALLGCGPYSVKFNEQLKCLSENEQNVFEGIRRKLKDDITNRDASIIELPFTYVFVRQDISCEQQLVQAAHATLEVGTQLRPEAAQNLHFCVCGAPNEADLMDIRDTAISNGLPESKVVSFYEPDIGNQLTAFATLPLKGSERDVFRKYKRLTFGSDAAFG